MESKTPRIVAIVEARMASTRLPGKVLMKIGSDTAIAHVCHRLLLSGCLDEVTVATTLDRSDDQLCNYLDSRGIPYFRGSAMDVLARITEAARAFGADAVLKATGDCPLIDPAIVSQIVCSWKNEPADFVANTIERTFPDGMDCGVMTTRTLEAAHREACDPLEREHTSLFVRRNAHKFNLRNVAAPPELTWPELALTLDTEQDLHFMNQIILGLKGEEVPSLLQIIQFLRQNPSLLEEVRHVTRKGDS